MSSDSRTCSNPDCGRPHYAKGMCNLHWQRARSAPPRMRPREVVAARDESGRKQCLSCLEWLPTTEYSPQKASRDGLQVQCGACRRFAKHGLTPSIAADIMAQQNGSCAVCSRDLGASFHIDHDHQCCPGATSCGRCVRGFLCSSCNQGLGMFRDSPEILRLAAACWRRMRAAQLEEQRSPKPPVAGSSPAPCASRGVAGQRTNPGHKQPSRLRVLCREGLPTSTTFQADA